MKKIIIFFLMILSITVFSEEYKPYLKKNTNNKNLCFKNKGGLKWKIYIQTF